jgi:hypothetical protein
MPVGKAAGIGQGPVTYRQYRRIIIHWKISANVAWRGRGGGKGCRDEANGSSIRVKLMQMELKCRQKRVLKGQFHQIFYFF